MIRMFETNRVRLTKELDGVWPFTVVREDGMESKEKTYSLPVPGCC